MRAALVALLISGVVLAEDDAPKRVAVSLRPGTIVQSEGDDAYVVQPGDRYVPAASYVAIGAEMAGLKAENAALKDSIGVPVPLVVLGLVLAAGAGFAVAKVAR